MRLMWEMQENPEGAGIMNIFVLHKDGERIGHMQPEDDSTWSMWLMDPEKGYETEVERVWMSEFYEGFCYMNKWAEHGVPDHL